MGLKTHRVCALALSTLLVLAGPVHAQNAKMTEKGLVHFKAGNEYLANPDGPRYEDALREFRAAAAEGPTSWRTQYNIALCAQNLERDLEAIQAYERALAMAGKEGEEGWRRQVESYVEALKAGLVRLTIRVRPPGASVIDERVPASGKPILNRYQEPGGSLALGIHPGRHRIIAVAGSKSAVWEFDAEAGSSLSHEFVIEPAKVAEPQAPIAKQSSGVPQADHVNVPPKRGLPSSVYVGAMATGVLAIGTTMTGLIAFSRQQDYDERNDGRHVAEADAALGSAKQARVITYVLLGATVLAAGGTLYLYATRPEPTAERARATLRVEPTLGPGAGGVVVSGGF